MTSKLEWQSMDIMDHFFSPCYGQCNPAAMYRLLQWQAIFLGLSGFFEDINKNNTTNKKSAHRWLETLCSCIQCNSCISIHSFCSRIWSPKKLSRLVTCVVPLISCRQGFLEVTGGTFQKVCPNVIVALNSNAFGKTRLQSVHLQTSMPFLKRRGQLVAPDGIATRSPCWAWTLCYSPWHSISTQPPLLPLSITGLLCSGGCNSSLVFCWASALSVVLAVKSF